jgi:predicted nicotinamide N-methyase
MSSCGASGPIRLVGSQRSAGARFGPGITCVDMAPEAGGTTDAELLEIIQGYTRLDAVPLVPEIRVHQAGEPIDLWENTELATGRSGLDPPFWAFAWAGGRALARYLLDHPEVVRGRHAVDVASGSGLVAIAAAKAGAATVTAYDIDELAVAAIGVNARANGAAVRAIRADILDDGLPAPAADLVTVADAFYESNLAARVTGFLVQARARGAAILAGDFGRTYLPRTMLVPVQSYDVPGLRMIEGSDVKRTTIWTLRDRQDEERPG